MRRSQWRTLLGLLLLGAYMLAALQICSDQPNGPSLLSTTVEGLKFLGLWLAGKAAAEHVANAKKPEQADPPK